jgi:hypothetical protein
MSVVEPGAAGAGLIARVKSILLQPKPTWEVIDREPSTISSIYRSYVIPLAAIPAVCGAIGSAVVGVGALGINVKVGVVPAIVNGIVGYALALAGVYVIALIIEALAPNFGGVKDRTKAFKVAAYSYTPGWVAGVLMLLPTLSPLIVIASIYGLLLLFWGLPRLMKAPEDKAAAYTGVVIVVAIVVSIVIGAIVGAVGVATGGLGAMGALSRNDGAVSGSVKIGDAEVDLGKLQAASKQMEAAAKQMEAAANNPDAVPVTDPEVLKTLLPASVAGYARSEVSSSTGGVGGMNGSQAEASYVKGDASFKLTITDLGAAGALGAMANAFNVRSSSESNGKYEKTGKVDGRMTTESYDRNTKQGEFLVLAGDRFSIAAEGSGVSINDLKAAVAAVNPARLEGLAKKG